MCREERVEIKEGLNRVEEASFFEYMLSERRTSGDRAANDGNVDLHRPGPCINERTTTCPEGNFLRSGNKSTFVPVDIWPEGELITVVETNCTGNDRSRIFFRVYTIGEEMPQRKQTGLTKVQPQR